MQVILLDKIQNLGNLGDMVNVRPGYGRNFLIPRGKAVPATAENRKRFEAQRAELERKMGDALAEAQARRDRFANQVVTIAAMAGEEGKLFGSIGTVDIADAFTNAGLPLKKQEIRLPTGPIRHTGEHKVNVHFHPDVDCEVSVNVVAG